MQSARCQEEQCEEANLQAGGKPPDAYIFPAHCEPPNDCIKSFCRAGKSVFNLEPASGETGLKNEGNRLV
jgi:hypothetical protein